MRAHLLRRPALYPLLILVTVAVALVGCSGAEQNPQTTASTAGGISGADTALAAVLPPDGGSSVTLPPGITVRGVGRVTGTPDTLRATIGVEVTRPEVQPALDAANAAVADVLAALEAAGVAEDDIQTAQFSVQPQYRYAENEPPTVTGYLVTNLVEVKIRDLDNVGSVLSEAITAGGDAARVHGISFALEDNAELLSQARAAAFAEARTKAEQYAELAGVELGELQAISEVTADLPQPEQVAGDVAEEAASRAAPVPVRPGSQEVTVTVTASWGL